MAGLEGDDIVFRVRSPTDTGWTDLSSRSIISAAEFESSASAQPGTGMVVMRDVDRDLTPPKAGWRAQLLISGVPMWGGYVRRIGRRNFFPAGDSREDTRTRQWVLQMVDYNILWDARILYRKSDPTRPIPDLVVDTQDGAILRTALASHSDMPSWLDITTEIDDVRVPASGAITTTDPWAYPENGSKLRALAEDLARWSGAVYWIGADEKVHYHAIQDRESPWGFSDRPNNGTITQMSGFEGVYSGFRELSADEDGGGIITDAFVWGGSPFTPDGGAVKFARATDLALEDVYDRWQYAETHFNERNYKLQAGVTIRANMIVYGNPTGDASGSQPGSVVGEGPRGARFPGWTYSFTWFSKHVPALAGVPRHLIPGDIVPIQLWTFSEDSGATPFTKLLPLRQARVSFPSGAKNGKAHVQFSGLFDLRLEDPFTLWKYLRQRERPIQQVNLGVASSTSGTATYGALFQGPPTPGVGDGVTTVFVVAGTSGPFPYIAGTTEVYLNGILQRRGTDYTESNPDAAEFTFVSAPLATDQLFVVCRLLGS